MINNIIIDEIFGCTALDLKDESDDHAWPANIRWISSFIDSSWLSKTTILEKPHWQGFLCTSLFISPAYSQSEYTKYSDHFTYSFILTDYIFFVFFSECIKLYDWFDNFWMLASWAKCKKQNTCCEVVGMQFNQSKITTRYQVLIALFWKAAPYER